MTGADVLSVTAPSWRPDLTDPYDYVEEVGRLIGYEDHRAGGTAGSGRPRPDPNHSRLAGRLPRRWPQRGSSRCSSFPFVSVADLDKMGVPAGPRAPPVEQDHQPALGGSALPEDIAAAGAVRGGDPQPQPRQRRPRPVRVRLCLLRQRPAENGAPRPPVSQRPADSELAALDRALGRQPRHLAVVLCGLRRTGWFTRSEPVDWTHPIASVETAAAAVGIALERRSATRPPWHPGRCAEFFVDDTIVGYAGELHPEVCRAFDLPARTSAAEIDLDAVIAAAPTGAEVPPISGFPMAKEDVALVVPQDVPAAAVERALRSGAGPLLESLALFDVYTGPPVPPGHKSLAYALRFRGPDRTLTDAETAAARDAAVAAAAEQTRSVQRTLYSVSPLRPPLVHLGRSHAAGRSAVATRRKIWRQTLVEAK